jgi:uncharacterized Zn-binding protein involved in type VI secretion
MGQPAAKRGDQVVAVDVHVVMVPAPPKPDPVPTPLPHPFAGKLTDKLSGDVNIMGQPAAVQGSVAKNLPPHLPTPPGTAFQNNPRNEGTVLRGSGTVRINGKAAARVGDPVTTCNDVNAAGTGTIVGGGSVLIGG